ncbi:hypothetical protein [Mycolicibacterium gilvum]|uniref:Heavy metal translocating P-type ATPase n=1 Tax=Mycolicibacterium gilvum TaxID=1804 RepID=A0A378SNF8_9MYCO|nr:hypothetical protein [Mycolicibacterium gilvum]MCV7055636.1 hypothetical protein [Mycolicibacterium gilvum]STZ44342.1 heavy metal translocating P-type ATPase [Mycolicibacterium gilvum]
MTAYAANHTASITYEPTETPVAQPRPWVRDYESHCAGRVVPDPACDSPAGASAELAELHLDANREENQPPLAEGPFLREMMGHRGLAVATGTAIIAGAELLAARGPLLDSAATMETSISSITAMSTHSGALTERQPTVTDFVVGMGGDELVGRVSAIESASEHPAAAATVDDVAASSQKRFRFSDLRSGRGRTGTLSRVDGGQR